MKKTIALTGATGFVGSTLLKSMGDYRVVVIGRSKPDVNNVDFFSTDFSRMDDLQDALNNVDIVIHCAARATPTVKGTDAVLQQYVADNTSFTEHLAKESLKAGVEKFVFLSSFKVNGETSENGLPINGMAKPNPSEPYATSKHLAEQAIVKVCNGSAMKYVIIRPPLVYGKGAKGNFNLLLKVIKMGLPLPLGSVSENKRSWIFVENLTSFIIYSLQDDKTDNQIWLVSDPQSYSTRAFLQLIAKCIGKSPRLVPFPISLLKLSARVLGKAPMVSRLVDSFELDMSDVREKLDWQPPYSVERAMEKTLR